MSTPLPDHLPKPPAAGLVFWRDQWAWITTALSLIYDSTRTAQAEPAALSAIQNELEKLVTQEADLTAAVAANTAATATLVAAITPLTDAVNAEIADVKRLTDLLNAGPPPSPAIADAIAALQASTTALETANANVGTETAALTADDPAV